MEPPRTRRTEKGARARAAMDGRRTGEGMNVEWAQAKCERGGKARWRPEEARVTSGGASGAMADGAAHRRTLGPRAGRVVEQVGVLKGAANPWRGQSGNGGRGSEAGGRVAHAWRARFILG